VGLVLVTAGAFDAGIAGGFYACPTKKQAKKFFKRFKGIGTLPPVGFVVNNGATTLSTAHLCATARNRSRAYRSASRPIVTAGGNDSSSEDPDPEDSPNLSFTYLSVKFQSFYKKIYGLKLVPWCILHASGNWRLPCCISRGGEQS